MARRRGRAAAMAAAGLATLASPLLFGQQVAGAAVTSAHDDETLSFQTDIQAVDCTVSVDATHDTDNAAQPTLTFFTGLSGPGACFDSALTNITATYKDREGVTRTVTFVAFGTTSGSITGAYTGTSVRADVHFFNCTSSTCDVTVIASPK